MSDEYTAEKDVLIHHRNEAAMRKPWLYAEGESWWTATGYFGPNHEFTDCIAQVVPPSITGVDDGDGPALFSVTMLGGKTYLVSADQITHARRLVFVLADEPATAYYTDEQEFITRPIPPERPTA